MYYTLCYHAIKTDKYTRDSMASFLNTENKVYLQEAAEYLEARGLTTTDAPIVPYATKNLGLSTKEGLRYHLEGWAYQVKGFDGKPNGQLLMRVCNWPAAGVGLYQNKKLFKRRPKFLQLFEGNMVHFASPLERVSSAKAVMLHEKISSAELTNKLLNITSIAVSGCAGWSSKGELIPELVEVIRLMQPGAQLVVCFDGDIIHNSSIMLAASQLKASVHAVRQDIEITFPMVPDQQWGPGWDDWVMGRGISDDTLSLWVEVLGAEGVPVEDTIPLSLLIKNFGISTTELNKKVELEQTIDNYFRLLNAPQFENYRRCSITGHIYEGLVGPKPFGDFVIEVQRWLERHICRGYGGKVRPKYIEQAVAMKLSSPCSMPLEILRSLPPATLEEAKEASHRLLTKGFNHIGPMPQDQAEWTMLAIARDLCRLWSTEDTVEGCQWVVALLGPSGVGKSNFTNSFLEVLWNNGMAREMSVLTKEGSRATLEEYNRACSGSLVATFDEYNPNDYNAKHLEQNIFTLSSTRVIRQRELYQGAVTTSLRHAGLFLTTVNTESNRNFIRSALGTGERRFITFELLGTTKYDGHVTGDRKVIAECGDVIMRWAAHFGEELTGDATNFSREHTAAKHRQSPVIEKIDAGRVQTLRTMTWLIRPDGKAKFSTQQLGSYILGPHKISRQDLLDLGELVVEMGGASIGKAKVSVSATEHVQKDNAYAVENFDNFCLGILAKI